VCVFLMVCGVSTIEAGYTGFGHTGLHIFRSLYRRTQQNSAELNMDNLYESRDYYTGYLVIPDSFWSRPYKFFVSGITSFYCSIYRNLNRVTKSGGVKMGFWVDESQDCQSTTVPPRGGMSKDGVCLSDNPSDLPMTKFFCLRLYIQGQKSSTIVILSQSQAM
jgi:hypothetical protein